MDTSADRASSRYRLFVLHRRSRPGTCVRLVNDAILHKAISGSRGKRREETAGEAPEEEVEAQDGDGDEDIVSTPWDRA